MIARLDQRVRPGPAGAAGNGLPGPAEIPIVDYAHLYRLSDECGLFEHAELTRHRAEHGYCVDDVSRGLLVAVREPRPSARLQQLAQLYLRFLTDAQVSDGRFHNRRTLDRSWSDEPSLEDCWGRAVWGLGAAVAYSPVLAAPALTAFDISVDRRSPWVRAMAFAALGAADVLRVRPDHLGARALLGDAADLILGLGLGTSGAEPVGTEPVGAEPVGTEPVGAEPVGAEPSPTDLPWRWPEPRLSYANAILPEVLLAAGSLLGDPRARAEGLAMLGWLLAVETAGDHLSITAVGGWVSGEPRPGFDQQPIEVAALADACARAFDLTGHPQWRAGVLRSAGWFLGDNDAETALYDPISHGGCDGLERFGRNENQGAESTLAMLSTFQQAHRVLGQRGDCP